MRKKSIRWLAALLMCALLGALPGVAARAAEDEIRFLSYEQALNYFDFDKAATNWCYNFGWDPDTRLGEARAAILKGMDPELIIRLATYARDTGHGDEKLVVNSAFRPACYQEVIALHDSNANTGPYRNNMTWNGRSLTQFWWNAETAPGWPEAYAIDLSDYDLDTLDLRYYYRAALRLWDNGWIGNYWIATNFATSYEYGGRTYAMADYGIYKPLQPGNGSRGEEWHITSSPSVLALGNYDGALAAGYEVVYALYYNPSLRGWSMADGRGVYIGAGVTVLQIRLCQLGLLEPEYVTGYYCSRTDRAVRDFQTQEGLEADGVCGAGTMALLFPEAAPVRDAESPAMDGAMVTGTTARSILLQVSGSDDTALNAFRADTRREGEETWVSRYYNAPASGAGELDIDIWQQGSYEVRVAAVDAAGNESQALPLGSVFVDATPPVIRRCAVRDITEDGFSVTCQAEDNGLYQGFLVLAAAEDGRQEERFFPAGSADCRLDGLDSGIWTVTVIASDAAGNESRYTFTWQHQGGVARPGLCITHFG